jgi:hypothetical protein
MIRFLPVGFLFLAVTARAQQSDSLRASVQDSLISLRPNLVITSDPSVTKVEQSYSPPSTIQPAFSRVAGVQVTPYSGSPSANAVVRIRGAASLADYSQPLYVVDEIPVFQRVFPSGSSDNLGRTDNYEHQQRAANRNKKPAKLVAVFS